MSASATSVTHWQVSVPAVPEDAPRIATLTQAAAPDCIPMDSREVAGRIDEFEVVRATSGQAVATAAVRRIEGRRVELRSSQ